MTSIIKGSIAAILLGIVGYLLLRNGAAISLADIQWPFVALASVFILLLPLLKHIRFSLILKASRQRIDRRSLAVHYAVPIIGMLTPGRLGEGAKIMMLSGDRKRLGFAFLVEKSHEAATLLAIGAAAMISFSYFTYAYIAIALIVGLSIAALLNIERAVNIVLRRNILKDRWFLANAKKMGWAAHAAISLISIAGWLLNGVVALLLMRALGHGSEPILFVLLYLLSVIIGLASGLPGGLGARELSSVLLFQNYLGISAGTASAFAALNLVLHYALLSLAGSAAYIIYMRDKPRRTR